MADDAVCQICPRSHEEHMVAEREGAVRHQFSKDGQLRPVQGAKVSTDSKEAPKTSGISGDPVLRFLLIQAGIITPEDLTTAEAMLVSTGMLKTDARHT